MIVKQSNPSPSQKVPMSRLLLGLAMLIATLFPAASEAAPAASAREKIDVVRRTAVISAFEPEWKELLAALKDRQDRIINGTTFALGTINGRAVVLFLSGISMVNAAMMTQQVIDHFVVSEIVFSGIGGAVNPDLSVGDVIVPDRWSEYLEGVLARKKNGVYVLPQSFEPAVPNLGMLFPQPVQIIRPDGTRHKILWFEVDERLLKIARAVANDVELADRTCDGKYVGQKPRIVIGGRGISGSLFVDNAVFRDYARTAFGADVLDMESAAIAHVAHSNQVPFIVSRSLSDLAGKNADENQMDAFGRLASRNSASFVKSFLGRLH